MIDQKPVFGRVATAVGVFCVVGLALVIIDMAQTLPLMPEEWWHPPEEVHTPPFQFNLRMMVICPGPIGWLGMWGYLVSWVWLPYAAWRALRASRSGARLLSRERILLAVVPLQILVVQVLLRATPLKYAYPLV